jgi:hypothetical protein
MIAPASTTIHHKPKWGLPRAGVLGQSDTGKRAPY